MVAYGRPGGPSCHHAEQHLHSTGMLCVGLVGPKPSGQAGKAAKELSGLQQSRKVGILCFQSLLHTYIVNLLIAFHEWSLTQNRAIFSDL